MKLSAADRIEVVARVRRGASVEDLAREYDVTEDWVYKLARRDGVVFPTRPFRDNGRPKYLGARVRTAVKTAVTRRAAAQRKSRGQVMDEVLAAGFTKKRSA